MEIKILGAGCAKCKTTVAIVEKVVSEANIEATIEKVEDMMEIMRYQILSTPAVIVDGQIKIKGRVPSESEVRKALGL
ncbi:MAG: thioredoxin family protein [Bacteroidales bacterium]|jgi:small redox-active disulfide protein 2|nr:thioredoxin family protein [Bacteroidales bacterium]MDD2264941.1 thioredoxin family protein [Bacteroidales bacterium]MDD2831935.1 thioredoxin family protein [Bacteroidales bacterium]MDD3209353.1 thioredoxin family protein [Bacteroidales bacterium]MDD3698019.1 thioredoxin family protein [Bacteroidales bacterium]